MKFELSKKQIKYLKNDDITIFPNNSIKLITYTKDNSKKFLIINLYKLNGFNNCTQYDFLEVLKSFNEAGWKFFGSMYPYVYFYKNKSLIKRIFNV